MGTTKKTSLVKRLMVLVREHKNTFWLCTALMIFTTFVRTIGPVFIQKAIDDYIKPGNFEGLSLLLGGYISLLVVGYFANYFEIIKLESVGQEIIAQIKNQSFEKLLTLKQSFFDKSSTGKMVSRIENDTDAMKILFTSVITNVVGSFLLLILMVFVMAFFYSSKIALGIVAIIPFMGVAAWIFDKKMAPYLIEIRKYIGEVTGYISEIVNGIAIIQIFGQEKRVLAELETRSAKKYKLESHNAIMFNSFFNVLFFMEVIGTVVIITIGSEMVLNKQLTLGSLFLFLNFIRYFLMPIIQLSGQFNEFQKGISAATRVFELIDNNEFEPDSEMENNISLSKNISIEFRNVWFKYNDETDWVLKDLSFFCPIGEHWAIVGSTGSGKTTIISLLLKFYNPQQGDILLNGINIRDLSNHQVRSLIGLVLQDNILFPGTIMDNLKIDQTYDEAEIKEMLTKLGIDKVINQLPDKYETELKENAQNLSAGEKQLISFGRALLKNPSILIFDEATSNIDPEIENSIKRAMDKLMEGRTSLIIAHRLSTIEKTDRILVLEKGHLIESGHHKDLLKTEGFYSKLNALQAG